MRYLVSIVLAVPMGVIGCSETSGSVCDGAHDTYDCIDQPLCTPASQLGNYVDCSNMMQEECVEHVEVLPDGPGFCKQVIDEEGSIAGYYWVLVAFCDEDADCPEGYECVRIPEFGMRKGECSERCIDECAGDEDCPHGQSCIVDIACGRCSPVANGCWDGMAAFCS